MHKRISIILILLICLCSPVLIFAEIIVLNSGKTVEGKLIEKTDKYIKIDFQGVPLTYYFDEIESIDEKSVSVERDKNIPIITYEQMSNSMEQESQQAVRDNPKSAKAYNDRGIAFRMNGNQEEAINYFSKAIEIEPDYAEAYGNRGLSYASSQVGNYELALADFNKAIEKDPKNGEYYFLRASSYFEQREYDKAWDDINEAKALGLGTYSDFYPEFINELKQVSGRDK